MLVVCAVMALLTAAVWLWFRWVAPLPARDKAIFISGCDTGIGYRLALHFHRLGCTVFAGCLEPDGSGAQQLQAEGLTVVPLDVTQETSIAQAVALVEGKIPADQPGLWALVSNAGVLVFGEFDWLTNPHCHHQIDVNLRGAILLTKAFLPLLMRRKGRLVVVTSMNGSCAYPGMAVYCATKFGLEGFCDSLRVELRKSGVHVGVVQPEDLARHTRIMATHEQRAEEMWEAMTEDKRRFYGDYFRDFHRATMQNYGLTSPVSFEESPLLRDVQHALLDTRPKARYVSAPLRFRLFFAIVRLMPTEWSDRLFAYISRLIIRNIQSSSTP